jgi:hypothetical protein
MSAAAPFATLTMMIRMKWDRTYRGFGRPHVCWWLMAVARFDPTSKRRHSTPLGPSARKGRNYLAWVMATIRWWFSGLARPALGEFPFSANWPWPVNGIDFSTVISCFWRIVGPKSECTSCIFISRRPKIATAAVFLSTRHYSLYQSEHLILKKLIKKITIRALGSEEQGSNVLLVFSRQSFVLVVEIPRFFHKYVTYFIKPLNELAAVISGYRFSSVCRNLSLSA